MKKFLMVVPLLAVCALTAPAFAGELDFSSPAAKENFEQYGDMASVDSVTMLVAAIQTRERYDEVAYRSSGCSTGCSVGCSVGCSSGCSVGCSMGCRLR